jgi:regulator of cell morphogenesis and NO signaling
MIFTKNTKMADLILNNHHLLSVVNRFGITLGFGEKTVDEVCTAHNVDTGFFLEIVNAFNEPGYFPHDHLEDFSLSLIISYLKNTHDYYLNHKIPEIGSMIKRLLNESDEPLQKELVLIDKFFNEYRDNLTAHIKREENTVYPYILKLEKYYKDPQSLSENDINELKTYAIERYAEEHDDIQESLYDLKSLIIKYLPPQQNNVLCYKILGQLGHLEKDINDHSNMENRVLIPRVELMEKSLKA